MDAAKRAVELNPYDMGARGMLGICHFVIGEHREAIELFSMAVQRGNSDPRYQWAALLAFSHYLLGQYDATLSWAREELYLNPNHLQVLAIRAAALAQLGRSRRGGKGDRACFGNYPDPDGGAAPAEFPLEEPADVAHYRDGLLKAGVPSTRLTLVEPTSNAPRSPDRRPTVRGRSRVRSVRLTRQSNSAKTPLHPEVVRLA